MNQEARQILVDYEREKRASISIQLAGLNLAYQVSLEAELALPPVDELVIEDYIEDHNVQAV